VIVLFPLDVELPGHLWFQCDSGHLLIGSKLVGNGGLHALNDLDSENGWLQN
jgi:hypothetical protein